MDETEAITLDVNVAEWDRHDEDKDQDPLFVPDPERLHVQVIVIETVPVLDAWEPVVDGTQLLLDVLDRDTVQVWLDERVERLNVLLALLVGDGETLRLGDLDSLVLPDSVKLLLSLLPDHDSVPLRVSLSRADAVMLTESDPVQVAVWLMALVQEAVAVRVGVEDTVLVMLDADTLGEDVGDNDVHVLDADAVPDLLAVGDEVPVGDLDPGVEDGVEVGETLLVPVLLKESVQLSVGVGEVLRLGVPDALVDTERETLDEALVPVAVPLDAVTERDAVNVPDLLIEDPVQLLPDRVSEAVKVHVKDEDKDTELLVLMEGLCCDRVLVHVRLCEVLQVGDVDLVEDS